MNCPAFPIILRGAALQLGEEKNEEPERPTREVASRSKGQKCRWANQSVIQLRSATKCEWVFTSFWQVISFRLFGFLSVCYFFALSCSSLSRSSRQGPTSLTRNRSIEPPPVASLVKLRYGTAMRLVTWEKGVWMKEKIFSLLSAILFSCLICHPSIDLISSLKMGCNAGAIRRLWDLYPDFGDHRIVAWTSSA